MKPETIADFNAQLRQYFPVPDPIRSENGWITRFEPRRGNSGGTDLYLFCSLADGTTDYIIYNDLYDDIWEIRDKLTGMDADTIDVDVVLRGNPVSVRLYKACDWSWWAYSQGIHKKLRVSWQSGVYEVVHQITEFNGDRLFR